MPENPSRPPKRKFTLQEKAQVYELHRQGIPNGEIAQRMGVENAQQISGLIRAAINFDKIPGSKDYIPKVTQVFPEPAIQMGVSAPQPPVAPPVVQPSLQAPAVGLRAAPGCSGPISDGRRRARSGDARARAAPPLRPSSSGAEPDGSRSSASSSAGWLRRLGRRADSTPAASTTRPWRSATRSIARTRPTAWSEKRSARSTS